MRAELVSILASVATAVSVVLAVPQVWRTLVQGRTGGLSVGHVWSGVVMSATWVQYGLHAGAVGATVSSVLGGVLNGLVLLGLLRAQPLGAVARQSAAVLTVAGLWLACHAALVAAGGLAVVGTLTAGASVAAQVPQVLHMLRRPDLDLSGISATTWRLSALSNLCWVGYWGLLGEPALVLPPVAGLLATAVVLALLAAGARPGAVPGDVPADGAAPGLRPTAAHRGRRVLPRGRSAGRSRRLPTPPGAGSRGSRVRPGRPSPARA